MDQTAIQLIEPLHEDMIYSRRLATASSDGATIDQFWEGKQNNTWVKIKDNASVNTTVWAPHELGAV
ncbi:unnamed protein product [Absidia cylindrospora]